MNLKINRGGWTELGKSCKFTVLQGLLKYRLGKQWRLKLSGETLMEEADITWLLFFPNRWGTTRYPVVPVCCNRQYRIPPGTQSWWKAESESHQASRLTTAHREHKGQIHISSENTVNQNQNVDNSPGRKNGALFMLIKWYDPQP